MKKKISEINITFFVREVPDKTRIQFFVDRRTAGETLEAVEVDPTTGELIDGRTRIAAAEIFGDTEIDVIYKKYPDRESRIGAALAANAGGALPPSPKDIQHVVECLLGMRLSRKRIIEIVSTSLGVSPEFMRNSISRVMDKLKMIQVNKAVAAVGGGEITMQKAAEEFGVDIEMIKTAMGVKKNKVNHKISQLLALKNITSGASRSIGAKLKYLQNLVTEGEMTKDDAVEIIGDVQKSLKVQLKHNENWMNRFCQSEAAPKFAKRHSEDLIRKKSARVQKKAANKSDPGDSALELMGLGGE